MTEEEILQAGKDYQNGEDMSDDARTAEDIYIDDLKMQNKLFHVLYKLGIAMDDEYSEFDDVTESICRGAWQMKYGFYRSYPREFT